MPKTMCDLDGTSAVEVGKMGPAPQMAALPLEVPQVFGSADRHGSNFGAEDAA